MNCTTEQNKRRAAEEKSGHFAAEPRAMKISTRVRNLIISQLEAAAPASLPLNILFRGVRCECEKITCGDVQKILRGLCKNRVILFIGESGMCDRYKIVDDYVTAREELE